MERGRPATRTQRELTDHSPTRVALAVFRRHTDAERARRALADDAAVKNGHVRLHEGSLDPLLIQELAVTATQRRRETGLLWRILLPLGLGFTAGWAVEVLGSPGVFGWSYLGGIAGAVVAVQLVLGRRRDRIEAMTEAAANAVERGETVLSVQFHVAQDAHVRRQLQAGGGALLGVA